MGGSFLSAVVVVLLSDSVIGHRIRRTGAVPGEAEAVQVPASHGSVEKFDSSPALTHLQNGAPNAPVAHSGPVNPQRPSDSHAAYYMAHMYPEDHPPFQQDAVARPTKVPFGEPASRLTEQPGQIGHAVGPEQFHPTHSFFGCQYFGGCPGDAHRSSLPPTGTKAVTSLGDGSSGDRNVLVADELKLPTSTGPALADHSNTAERALQNVTEPAPVVTDAVVHRSTVSTPTRSSPPAANLQLAQAAGSEGLRQRAGSLPGATIFAEVLEGTSKPPSPPDMQRGTGMAPGIAHASQVPAATTATTALGEGISKSTHLLSTVPTSETSKLNSTVPPRVPLNATVEVLPRQSPEENSTEAVPSGHTSGLTTQPSAPASNDSDHIIATTTPGQSSTDVQREESSSLLPLSTPPKTTSGATPSTTTAPPTLLSRRTEVANPSPTISSNGSDLTTAPAMQTSVADAQASRLIQTTAQTSQATTTTTIPRATVASPTIPTTTEGQTEAVSAHTAAHSMLKQPVRQATTAGTALAPDNKQPLEQVATSVSFQQTRPPSRPVPAPIPTARPTAPPDAYVRPITQHSTDQFVPHRDRDIEDYYPMHLPGHMEEFERRGQCGKCQRRLHHCVQKCFQHHSCEAEANTELSCPRINAPCLPPFKHEVDHCRRSADCEGANHLCCLVGCSRRCVLGVPTSHHWQPLP
ncbi:uncharacterized protein LOC144106242 [Amblyomma americanum]